MIFEKYLENEEVLKSVKQFNELGTCRSSPVLMECLSAFYKSNGRKLNRYCRNCLRDAMHDFCLYVKQIEEKVKSTPTEEPTANQTEEPIEEKNAPLPFLSEFLNDGTQNENETFEPPVKKSKKNKKS